MVLVDTAVLAPNMTVLLPEMPFAQPTRLLGMIITPLAIARYFPPMPPANTSPLGLASTTIVRTYFGFFPVSSTDISPLCLIGTSRVMRAESDTRFVFHADAGFSGDVASL